MSYITVIYVFQGEAKADPLRLQEWNALIYFVMVGIESLAFYMLDSYTTESHP